MTEKSTLQLLVEENIHLASSELLQKEYLLRLDAGPASISPEAEQERLLMDLDEAASILAKAGHTGLAFRLEKARPEIDALYERAESCEGC